MDIGKLIEKLQDPTGFKLSQLSLHYFSYPYNLSVEMANALCKVKSVYLAPNFLIYIGTIQQLIHNILNQDIKIKNFFMFTYLDWRAFISPEVLKAMIEKLTKCAFHGIFTLEQLEVARSIPDADIDAEGHVIKKGIQ